MRGHNPTAPECNCTNTCQDSPSSFLGSLAVAGGPPDLDHHLDHRKSCSWQQDRAKHGTEFGIWSMLLCPHHTYADDMPATPHRNFKSIAPKWTGNLSVGSETGLVTSCCINMCLSEAATGKRCSDVIKKQKYLARNRSCRRVGAGHGAVQAYSS